MSGASTAEPGRRVAAVLVLGIGNPILADDGIGWRVAEEVRARLEGPSSRLRDGEPAIEVDCVAVGGLSLMERLVGYDRAVLVDAVHGSGDPPGMIRARGLDEIPGREASHLDSAHDAPLQVALAAGRAMGARLPADIVVVTIEAERVDTFGETLTPAVAAAIPGAVDVVLGALGVTP